MGDVAKLSDAQKKLQGSSRYIKNSPASKPIARLWRPPADLGPKAKAYYTAIGKQLVSAGVLTDMDKPAFLELCQLYGQLNELREVLQSDGYVVRDSNGGGEGIKRHPASTLFKEALNGFMKLSEKFGLTPYDRKRIDLPVDKNPKDASREFFGL